MRISDWSSGVCSSDLIHLPLRRIAHDPRESGRVWLTNFDGMMTARDGRLRPGRTSDGEVGLAAHPARPGMDALIGLRQRKSLVEGKRGCVRVALGGRRTNKNKPNDGKSIKHRC